MEMVVRPAPSKVNKKGGRLYFSLEIPGYELYFDKSGEVVELLEKKLLTNLNGGAKMPKKKWTKPKLIVLVRGKPEEGVLVGV